jgi:hypothetical protein
MEREEMSILKRFHIQATGKRKVPTTKDEIKIKIKKVTCGL